VIELPDYFDFYPHIGTRLPQQHGPFICGLQLPFDDERDLVRVQLADQPRDNGRAVFLLDIAYFLNIAGSVRFEDALDWFGTAHDRVEVVFEGCIKDGLRENFGEVAT
jgi:uncharacterized protein (TIGR04255 family)